MTEPRAPEVPTEEQVALSEDEIAQWKEPALASLPTTPEGRARLLATIDAKQSEIDRLTEQLRVERGRADNEWNKASEFLHRAERAESKNRQLSDALEKYGRHIVNSEAVCYAGVVLDTGAVWTNGEPPCTCGLTAALSLSKEDQT